MTQLEQKLAEAISALIPGFDLVGIIIEAARGPCACEQTVGTPPAVVVTAQPEPAKRTRKAAVVGSLPEPEKSIPEQAPAPAAATPASEPEKAPEAGKPIPANAAGIDLTGLFEGTGASKKVVKDVFIAAVEKAKTLAALVALNEVCDCGFATGDYTEETAGVLKRKLNRWGAAQE